ncbi:MAG: hypothetical protein CMH54_13090 [Myxococcales bacterium]|nr:hypothetical protein [Myxococcales bacterium]
MSSPRLHRAASGTAGFTLLELMVAAAVLSGVIASIGLMFTTSSAMTASRSRILVATQLMRGLILDIEEYAQQEYYDSSATPEEREFPSDVEGASCDEYVPEPFNGKGGEEWAPATYSCTYDLVGIDPDIEIQSALDSEALSSLTNNVQENGGGASSKPNLELLQQSNMMNMASLLPLMGSAGIQVQSVCSINPLMLIQSIEGMTMFFPEVINLASKQIRKLTVRLVYKDEGEDYTMAVETFITADGRGEIDQLEKLENITNSLGNPGTSTPPTGGIK